MDPGDAEEPTSDPLSEGIGISYEEETTTILENSPEIEGQDSRDEPERTTQENIDTCGDVIHQCGNRSMRVSSKILTMASAFFNKLLSVPL